MATGFSTGISKGEKSLREYVIGYANFWLTVRDAEKTQQGPLNFPLLQEPNVSSDRERIAQAQAEIAHWSDPKAVTDVQIQELIREEQRRLEESYDVSSTSTAIWYKNYQRMLGELAQWEVAPIVAPFKCALLADVIASMNSDCHPDIFERATRSVPSPGQYRANKISNLRRNIDRLEEAIAEEQLFYLDRKQFVDALLAALPPESAAEAEPAPAETESASA